MMEACSIPGQFRDSHVSTGLTNPDHVSLGQIIDVTLAASYLPREPEGNGIGRAQNNPKSREIVAETRDIGFCIRYFFGHTTTTTVVGTVDGMAGHARVQGCSTLKSGAIGYRASASPRADQRSNLLLRVSSFGSTLRVYGVAAGGRLIPVGDGVNRFRFRYAFSDSVRRLGRMPCRRADDQAPKASTNH